MISVQRKGRTLTITHPGGVEVWEARQDPYAPRPSWSAHGPTNDPDDRAHRTLAACHAWIVDHVGARIRRTVDGAGR
jgi:hypothetical protein